MDVGEKVVHKSGKYHFKFDTEDRAVPSMINLMDYGLCVRCGQHSIDDGVECAFAKAKCRRCTHIGHSEAVCNNPYYKKPVRPEQLHEVFLTSSSMRVNLTFNCVPIIQFIKECIMVTSANCSLMAANTAKKYGLKIKPGEPNWKLTDIQGNRINAIGIIPEIRLEFKNRHCLTSIYVSDSIEDKIFIGLPDILSLKIMPVLE